MAPPGTLIADSQYSDLQSTAKVNHNASSPFRSAIESILARRSEAPELPTGIAAKGECDLYKNVDHGKPLARRWDHLLNAESRARQPCSLKAAAKYMKNPGLISLGGGLPSSDYFPLQEMELKVSRPPGGAQESSAQSSLLIHANKHDIAQGKSLFGMGLTDLISNEHSKWSHADLHVSLNYGQGSGSPQLLRYVTEHTEVGFSHLHLFPRSYHK